MLSDRMIGSDTCYHARTCRVQMEEWEIEKIGNDWLAQLQEQLPECCGGKVPLLIGRCTGMSGCALFDFLPHVSIHPPVCRKLVLCMSICPHVSGACMIMFLTGPFQR